MDDVGNTMLFDRVSSIDLFQVDRHKRRAFVISSHIGTELLYRTTPIKD
jgi:hypothetical protein